MTLPDSQEQPAERTAADAGWHAILLPDAPPPKGAYSPAVRAGDLVFVAGQVPRDPRTGELVGDDVAEQTRQVLRNIQGVLAAAGASLADIVAVTVYITDVDSWGTFDATYRELASRRQLPLASNDVQMRRAAIRSGVALWPEMP